MLQESLNHNKDIEESFWNMFKLQQKLNNETNGINWEYGKTKFNKNIDWLRCITMETVELIDSIPWKHWKNIDQSTDIENIKIELVDIWHFLMSEILSYENNYDYIKYAYSLSSFDINDIFNEFEMIKESEKLIFIVLDIKINKNTSYGINNIIEQFFLCCRQANLNYQWLQKLYIGKNCLNKFRQHNGYKEGTYIKIWNGREDNMYMIDLLESKKTISFHELYEQLDIAYNNVT